MIMPLALRRRTPYLVGVLPKLIKLNAWLAFACGVFALIMAPQIIDAAAIAMGQRPDRVNRDEVYLVAVSLLRVCGILMLAYSTLARIVLKSFEPLEHVRVTLTVFAIGLLVWGGTLLFLIPTRSAILLTVVAIALLEWLAVPLWLLFNYKKTDDWKSMNGPTA